MDDRILRAIANPRRRSLLGALALQPGQSATSLAAELHVSRQATQRHLALLEAAGITMSARCGRTITYRLNPTLVADEA